jgi:hypothetical protein
MQGDAEQAQERAGFGIRDAIEPVDVLLSQPRE